MDFTEARDSEWQCHQLARVQVCTSLQTDNHASTHRSVFYRPDALPATQPTASKRWRQKHWGQTTLSLYFNLESLTCWEIWSLHTWLMYLYSLCSLYNSLVKFWIVPSVLWRCWLGGRKGIRPVKNLEWSGTGMDICLERDTDMHMAQLMPLPLTFSCFSKIQIGFTFLAPADPGSPGKRAVKRARARACVRVSVCLIKFWVAVLQLLLRHIHMLLIALPGPLKWLVTTAKTFC